MVTPRTSETGYRALIIWKMICLIMFLKRYSEEPSWRAFWICLWDFIIPCLSTYTMFEHGVGNYFVTFILVLPLWFLSRKTGLLTLMYVTGLFFYTFPRKINYVIFRQSGLIHQKWGVFWIFIIKICFTKCNDSYILVGAL